MPMSRGQVWPYSRREFVRDIKSPTVAGQLGIQTVPVNPATTTFQWLSQITNAFEHYRFKKLKFLFRPTTNENTITTQTSLGTVTLYFNYDAADPPVSSRNEANNYQGSISARICDPIVYNVKCPAGSYYIRSNGALHVGQDIRESDFGYLGIVIENAFGATPGGTVGELWVEYEVDLWKPRIQEGIGSACLMTTIGGQPTASGGTVDGGLANTIGISVAQRGFLIDNFGSSGFQYLGSSLLFSNVFPFILRAGTTVEVEAIMFGTTAASDGPMVISLNTSVPTSANIPTGTVVAQQYYPIATGAPNNIIVTYATSLSTSTPAAGTNNMITKTCWRCTQDGPVFFKVNKTPAGANASGVFTMTCRLLNRPDFGKTMPTPNRPVLWDTPTLA